mmetsp:Transcript_13680/g.32821  ORF Transcript_13680/g.32821 Transcript_13680/m.32821 type:complete len:403 (-) Transcript_13680:293-1501(-)
MTNPLASIAATLGSPEEALAFMTPAVKTKPDYFNSIEEAESAGWIYNAATASWEVPAAALKSNREFEKLLKGLTDERVDAMGLDELRRTLLSFRDGDGPPPPPDSGAPVMYDPGEDEGTLRARVKECVPEFLKSCRLLRMNKSVESQKVSVRSAPTLDDVGSSARSAHSAGVVARGCKTCGQGDATDGRKLSCCAQCGLIWYCSRECQLADWKSHKVSCKQQSKVKEEFAAGGLSLQKGFDAMKRWYGQVPDLAEKVLCEAWTQRKQLPFIRAQGGVNARMAQVICVPRRKWITGRRSVGDLAEGPTKNAISYLKEPDFNPDVHYVVLMDARHPGAEDWPTSAVRMRYDKTPAEMDAFVRASVVGREALARREKEAATSRGAASSSSGPTGPKARVTIEGCD